MKEFNRREFIGGAAAMAAMSLTERAGAAEAKPQEWLAFSRVFQRFGCERTAQLLAEAGYTGVEWTVRPGGFVEPSRARTELPKAVAAAKRHGLTAENIIVDFLDPYEGANLDLLKCAADSGVKVFRPAYFRYDLNEKASASLDRIRRGFDRLDRAARETGLRMLYQNHSTYSRKVPLFGSLNWDLWEVVKDHDPKYIGVQYDFMHARAEMGPSWQRGLSLLGPWIGTLCLKDFRFGPHPDFKGDWCRVLLPPGEGGICEWDEFKAICRRERISAPYTIHYDYDTGPGDIFAADAYEQALACAKRDLERFRRILG